jgi:hypothetical protein
MVSETKTKRLTPAQAIKQECRFCTNSPVFHGCNSSTCKLNDKSIPHSRRIKAHCLTCAPEQSIHGVKKCSGKVIAPEDHICPLHPYRLGKNPYRQAACKKSASSSGRALFFKKKSPDTAPKNDLKTDEGDRSSNV